MDSSCLSSGTPKHADLFEDLWRQLGECHQTALQELEAKVSKLKKERCLDAQRLEVFYNRNQQLKEQNKTLQDTISLMEERLRAGECDQCAILEEKLKNNQEQNLRLIAKLKNEKDILEDENRKLHIELQKLKMSRSELQHASSPDQEDGIIPDSPVLPSTLPLANKLKKRRNVDKIKHVRYVETSLLQSNNSLFKELNKESIYATKNPGKAEVLVPNTCELDTPQITGDVNLNPEEAVAETCALELLDKPHAKTERAAGQQNNSKLSWRHLKPHRSLPLSTLIQSPDSTTETSPSLLPRIKRLTEDGSVNKAKRKKEENEPEAREEEDEEENQETVDKQREGKSKQPGLIKQTFTSLSSQTLKKEPLDSKVQSTQNGTINQRLNVSCTSPAFKKPNMRGEADRDSGGRRGKPLQKPNASRDQHEGDDVKKKHKLDSMWSIDPAVALSMYDSEWRGDEEKDDQQCHGELVDTDCTWVSHSLLQGRGENAPDRQDSVSGLGEKANDSLNMMFDTSAYGTYKSCNGTRLDQSLPCDDDDDSDDEEQKDQEEDDEQNPGENTMSQTKEHKARGPTFAHVAVVRKKDERRKLKGTTCKECEVYYAHLPDGEKQKKLSACSRHRFLYVPPCTPENFWEVGFPSTQTCIERGYIKEEQNPQARPRRRLPYNALFSPKRNQQES